MTISENKNETAAESTGRETVTGEVKTHIHRINMPGFIDEEIGLGDVIKRVTSAFGIKPCKGCERRAAALNRWLVFSPSQRIKK